MKQFSILFLSLLLLLSCKEDKSTVDPNVIYSENGINNGNESLIPLAVGNKWYYTKYHYDFESKKTSIVENTVLIEVVEKISISNWYESINQCSYSSNNVFRVNWMLDDQFIFSYDDIYIDNRYYVIGRMFLSGNNIEGGIMSKIKNYSDYNSSVKYKGKYYPSVTTVISNSSEDRIWIIRGVGIARIEQYGEPSGYYIYELNNYSLK